MELDVIEKLIDARMRTYLLDIEKKAEVKDEKKYTSQLDGYIAKLFLWHGFTEKIMSYSFSEEKKGKYLERCLAGILLFESRIKELKKPL